MKDFQADAKLKNEMIDLAIKRLGNENTTSPKEDPIKRYRSFTRSFASLNARFSAFNAHNFYPKSIFRLFMNQFK